MPTDLYSADLQRISSSELFDAISEFTQINRPLEDRPPEGYRLDFKRDLSVTFLHAVAAFANTFGGLVIVGVSDVDNRPDAFLGISINGELKTHVANLIAMNLTPCPPFDIAECELPNDPDRKKLCVVRVRETQEMCLLTKKGEKPVYVRVEDKSNSPDASQLLALLNRKRQSQNLAGDFRQRLDSLRNSLVVHTHIAGKQGHASPTYFKLVLCPVAHAPVRLDIAIERAFSNFITVLNPGLESLANLGEDKVDLRRGRDWYEVQLVNARHGYERRWRVTSRGEIGFVTQVSWPISGAQFWSLYDVAADLARTGALARRLWEHTSYYGNFRLEAELRVSEVRFESPVAHAPLFYARLGHIQDFSLDPAAVRIAKSTGHSGRAESEFDLDYTSLIASFTETVAAVVNELMRCLGHTSDFERLQQTVGLLIDGVKARS